MCSFSKSPGPGLGPCEAGTEGQGEVMEARELGEKLGEKEPERKGGRSQEGVKTERKMGAGKKGGKEVTSAVLNGNKI